MSFVFDILFFIHSDNNAKPMQQTYPPSQTIQSLLLLLIWCFYFAGSMIYFKFKCEFVCSAMSMPSYDEFLHLTQLLPPHKKKCKLEKTIFFDIIQLLFSAAGPSATLMTMDPWQLEQRNSSSRSRYILA